MSTQVIGSVNELEGPVSIMRDGETRSLAAGDSILAGDVIKASESGRAAVVLSNSYGEPIGNLLVAPGGSVIADTTIKNGQSTLVFEALSEDGVSISNLDPDFAELVELQGVEQAGTGGGMSGLFGGGLLAAGSMGGTAAAVGAGAVGLGLLASSSDDEGSGPTSTVSGPDNPPDNPQDPETPGPSPDPDMQGTTGTPLDAVVDPILQALATTPLAAVSEPLGDVLGMVGSALAGGAGGGTTDGPTGTPLDAVLGPLAEAAGGAGGGTTDGPTGTPLDAVLGPLAEAAGGAGGGTTDGPTGTPLDAVLGPLASAAGGAGGGTTEGPTGTPLDMVLGPLEGAAADSPLAPISSMLSPDTLTGALSGGLPV